MEHCTLFYNFLPGNQSISGINQIAGTKEGRNEREGRNEGNWETGFTHTHSLTLTLSFIAGASRHSHSLSYLRGSWASWVLAGCWLGAGWVLAGWVLVVVRSGPVRSGFVCCGRELRVACLSVLLLSVCVLGGRGAGSLAWPGLEPGPTLTYTYLTYLLYPGWRVLRHRCSLFVGSSGRRSSSAGSSASVSASVSASASASPFLFVFDFVFVFCFCFTVRCSLFVVRCLSRCVCVGNPLASPWLRVMHGLRVAGCGHGMDGGCLIHRPFRLS